MADNVELDIQPTDLVLFIGPSGSGKSSLLREASRHLGAMDVAALELPDESLVDALAGPVADRLGLLSSCGLAEARLALRTPSELSDGQRARFRMAFALSQADLRPMAIDEFAALLDRPLAKVLACNLRRLVTRTGIGALVATTHEDLTDELNPDVIVRCRGEGDVEVTRRDLKKKRPTSTRSFGSRPAPVPIGRTSLGGITAATASASPSASMLLWHGSEPIGICVFAAPAASLKLRSKYFGLTNRRPRRQARGADSATVGAVARGAAPDLSRCGHRCGISSGVRASCARCHGSRRSRRWGARIRFSSGPDSCAWE